MKIVITKEERKATESIEREVNELLGCHSEDFSRFKGMSITEEEGGIEINIETGFILDLLMAYKKIAVLINPVIASVKSAIEGMCTVNELFESKWKRVDR